MPLVSIVMTSYNHENFISEAIASVLTQNFVDFELIIIDDSSKDNSINIIKEFINKDGRVKALFHEENKGIAKTLNEGIDLATGKFLAFIASDDLWTKDKLLNQVKILETDENLVVWTEGELIDEHGNTINKLFTEFHNSMKKKKSGNIFNSLVKENYILGSSVIFKRENLGEIRFNEDLKYLNDFQFFVDMAKNYEYYFLNDPFTKYRIHDNNASRMDPEEWTMEYILLYEYFIENYSKYIQNETKASLFAKIGFKYRRTNEKKKARNYYITAIRLNPLSFMNAIYLIMIIIDKDGLPDKFLRKSKNVLYPIKRHGRK